MRTPMQARIRPALSVGAVALMIAGCGSTGPHAPDLLAQERGAPQSVACPSELPADARCWSHTDARGAHVLLAKPERWSGVLVVHAHGGPALGPPRAERALEDLKRWAVWVRLGHAYAGSSFAQGGVQVRLAGDDTERARQLFVHHVAQPQRTVLHGQSWGASVAAKAAERYGALKDKGRPAYDALLLTSGVLGGGTRSYDFRLDLRVVYQWLCGNHPKPDEPAYPLWMGLPAGSALDAPELRARARDCLGLGLDAARRTPEQARRLDTLLRVIRIPEASVLGHLNWATFHFADIARRAGERSVFENARVRYVGSPDDAALNAGVARYTADAGARAAFAADTDPTGALPLRTLSAHAIHDAVAFVELQHAFRETVRAAGAGAQLVQIYSDHADHSYWSDALYQSLLDALLSWSSGGAPPVAAALAADCARMAGARALEQCRVRVGYEPPPLAQRVFPRQP